MDRQRKDLYEVLAIAIIPFIAAIVLPLFAMYGLGGAENEQNLVKFFLYGVLLYGSIIAVVVVKLLDSQGWFDTRPALKPFARLAGITTNLSRHYDGGGVWANHSKYVNTTTVAPGGRVEHIITISGVAVPEISTPFCPSGYADFGTYCKQETNIEGGTKYSYIQYLRPNTDLTANESVTHNMSSSRFLDWTDRANVDAWVNDTQDNISFAPSDNGIAVTIEDGYSNSSVHKDILYETRVEYDNTGGSDDSGDDSDDSDDGGSGGGGGGGGSTTTTIIQNVTGAYSWTVAAPGSGSQRFQFFGYPGRTFSAPLELENTGSGPVNLSLQCLSSDGSCQWVDLSTDHVRLDASSFTETTVVVRGQVPLNASRDEYNFVVRVTDPSFNPANPEGGGKADVRFSVDMNRPLGFLIERYSRLAGIYTTIEAPDGAPLPEDAQGVPVPFVLIPLFFSGAVFAVARAVNDRTGPVLAVQILVALFVFILVAGVAPPL